MSESKQALISRLNSIQERISSSLFLNNQGIGNEVPYYVFDYQPNFELDVREHITAMLSSMKSTPGAPKTLNLNLFTVVLDYLKARDCYEAILDLEKESGTEEVYQAFQDILSPSNLCEFITENYELHEYDLLLIDGLGECWPFLRAHTILNNLQTFTSTVPVVLFYPGEYDGNCFHPFGLPVGKANYYRAFRLVD